MLDRDCFGAVGVRFDTLRRFGGLFLLIFGLSAFGGV